MIPVAQLKQLPFLQALPPWALDRLAEGANEAYLNQNALIVRQHDEARALFVLLSGSVQFLIRFEGVDDFLVGVTDEPGSLIGWSAFREPFRYTASVRCEESCRLLEIPRSVFEALFEDDPRLGYAVLKQVARAVANRLEQARDRLVAGPVEGPFRAAEQSQPQTGRLDEGELSDVGQPSETIKAPLDILQQSPFFEMFDPDQLAHLANIAKTVHAKAGSLVCEQGRLARGLYLLASGKVQLSFRTPRRVGKFGREVPSESLLLRTLDDPGQLLGWSAVVEPFRYRITVSAPEDTWLLVLDRKRLEQYMENQPAFALALMRRVLWVIGNRLRSTRIRLVAKRYDQETLAVQALLQQSTPELHVTSPLHKIPYYLNHRLTMADALHCLELVRTQGERTERNLAGLSLEILQNVPKEMALYQRLQNIYECVANAPREMTPEEVRKQCCLQFIELFGGMDHVLQGLENLPGQPGHIFIMNHLNNHPDNILPNDFVLTLDTHFVSAMILFKRYTQAPIRVIRKSRPEEHGHQKYYDRLGYIYVYAGYVDGRDSRRLAEERRRYFLDAAGAYLAAGINVVICPEGNSTETENSPLAFKPGAFRLAAHVRPEPLIVPIAVANFDKKITRSKTVAVVHKPFRLSEVLPQPLEDHALFEFLRRYQATYRDYVRAAAAMATTRG